MKANFYAKVNQNYKVTLNRKIQGQGHTERLQLKRSDQGSINMQSIKSVIINMNESKLKHKI